MPIRLRDSLTVVGRLRPTLGNATASLSGAHVAPPNVAGSISSRLGDAASSIVAAFTPAASRTGVIAATLQDATSSLSAASAPPLIPDRTGAVSTSLASVSCAFRGTITLPAQSSWWLNYPVANIAVLQGSSAQHILDPSQHNKMADHAAVIIQGFNWTDARLQSRCANIDLVLAQQSAPMRTRFGVYTSFQQALKDVNNDGDTRQNIDLINSPTEGNPLWWMRRVGSGAQIEAPFGGVGAYWMINGARTGFKNSLNETYQQALWRKRFQASNPSDDSRNLRRRLSLFFQDDVHARMQTPMSVNGGATTVTDPDMNNDGVAESITDFGAGANAGCRIWCEGNLDSMTAMESQFPGFAWFGNTARFPTDYLSGASPPKPLSGHPFYGKLELGLAELINLNFGIARDDDTLTYRYTGGGSLFNASRVLAIHAKMLRPDAQCRSGRAFVVVHVNTHDRTPTTADYEFARTMFLLSMLQERLAHSITIGATKPLSLNETLLEWGAPTSVRSMGTLNETTVSFTIKPPDVTVLAAQFYFVRCEKALGILRGDNPTVGVWPSADAAATCPLPALAAGLKYQRINENYTNPITGRSMRPQQPSLNNGADAGTSVSLKPMHGIVLRIVPA